MTAPAPRVLVVGAGSAGSRHARLCADLGADVAVFDTDGDRAASVAERLGVAVVRDPAAAAQDVDGVIVATPSSLHLDHALDALDAGALVMVEKPSATTPEDADRLAAAGGDRLAVAYNLRFHAPVAELVGRVHAGDVGAVHSARLWFGQWLPDWRPGVDYRTVYSARSDLGGGILLDASHELDLVVWLFGPGRYELLGGGTARVGPLEIDVEDTAAALLRSPSGARVIVDLDCLSRRYRRGIEIIGSEKTIRLDWARGTLETEDGSGTTSEPAEVAVEQSYREQARSYLGWLAGGPRPPVGGAGGAGVVALAEGIRALGDAAPPLAVDLRP